ncbi:MAG: FtsW/RodA/SpoVE family cell cycle protein [Bacteroidota bacterium]
MASVTSHIRTRAAALPPADKYVVWVVFALAALGVVAVYSAVSFFAETVPGGDTERMLFRHLGRMGLALAAVGVVSVLDYRRVAQLSKWLLAGALALLVFVQLSGVVLGGAQRWLEVGGVSFQPSDFAKVALILHLAVLLAKKQVYINEFERGFVPLLVWTVPTIALIGMEDLSTAAVLSAAVGVMMVVGRVPTRYLTALVAVGLLAAYLFLLTSPQRAARVESWLGAKVFPHTEAVQVFSDQDEGYQARQARIAIAMGGLTGVGPGKSVQRDFLPAPFNDFIFAIIAEEWGVLGAGALLFGFVVLLFQGFLRIARQAPDPLGLFLAVGLTTVLVLYGFVNAGVASGLLPVTGLPMPFVSYGGTSLLATGVMAGLLLNISRHATPA